MAAPEAPSPVRISQIAGRYLVFDPEAVSVIRRLSNTSGVLVGTAPQQPTQNIFLGLPIELRPEEVNTLVRQNAAYVVDNAAAHAHTLKSFEDPAAREAYIASLKGRKQAAQQVMAELKAQKAAEVAVKLAAKKASKKTPESESDRPIPVKAPEPEPPLSVTPTQSNELITKETEQAYRQDTVRDGPLCRFLQLNGYFMTPGLRFGAKYSVYPGDPLRFHAHFMANPYEWDEEVPVLDIVSGGRLATAVKKAFLIGGEEPAKNGEEPAVRTFCIEWAAM